MHLDPIFCWLWVCVQGIKLPLEKVSSGDFSLRQGTGKTSRTLRDGFGDGGGVVTFHGFLSAPLGFSRDGEYMGEEAESEATWWAQTHPRRGRRASRAWGSSGHPVPPFGSPSGSGRYGEIRYWVFVSCNSE